MFTPTKKFITINSLPEPFKIIKPFDVYVQIRTYIIDPIRMLQPFWYLSYFSEVDCYGSGDSVEEAITDLKFDICSYYNVLLNREGNGLSLPGDLKDLDYLRTVIEKD